MRSNLAVLSRLIVEQRKSALKKVSDELDEAEEIVRYPFPTRRGGSSCIDCSDGGGVTFHACIDSTDLSGSTNNLKAGFG